MYVFGLTLGQIESEILHKLWVTFDEDEFGAPKVEEIAFRRYSRDRVRRKVNSCLAEIVGITESLRTFCVITLKANQPEYLVPENCFNIERVLYFDSATDYVELPIKERHRLESLVPGWQTNPGTPEYAYAGDWSGMTRRIGVCPAPTLDGTTPTINDTTTYQISAPTGARAGVSGSAAPTSTSLTYVDSEAQDFVDIGVIVGQTIKNITDGSQGAIASRSGSTIICVSLTGGNNNFWTPGDLMRIETVEYGHMLITATTTTPYLVTSVPARLPFPGLTMARGNIVVEYYALPVMLTESNQYPEMANIFHNALVYGPAAELAEERPTDSPEFAKSKDYRQRYNESISAIKYMMATQYKGLKMVAHVRTRRRWR